MERISPCNFPIARISDISATRPRISSVSGAPPLLADAQFQIARQYGFPSWPKLKQHVESARSRPANSDQAIGRE